MTAETLPQTRARPTFRNLLAGDPAPTFRQRTTSNPDFVFDSVAGRYIVLGLYGSAGNETGRQALGLLQAHRALFDDDKIAFFGVSLDPADEGRVKDSLPGIRHFWDFDARISRLYGVAALGDGPPTPQMQILPRWVVIDPSLRVRAVIPFTRDGADRTILIETLKALPPIDLHAGVELMAPVLFLPGVFEPELCRVLIETYQAEDREMSGFMRQQGEMTVLRHDPAHKRRRDHMLEDEALMEQTRNRIRRRIIPEIQKVHQFEATRLERYLVACYTDDDLGHFRAHRDNTTKGTAHRRFAVSINLNDDFDGGEIGFPEYGSRRFKPPVGGAVVFSCSLLHEVSSVTRGRRYAFLPFLYDDAAAKVREDNLGFLDPNMGG